MELLLLKSELYPKERSRYLAFFYCFLIFCAIVFFLVDIVLYLCEKEHIEGGMIFQLLEDLTEMSTMRNCEDIFGYIESKQDILGKVGFIILLVLLLYILPHESCIHILQTFLFFLDL